MQKGEVKIALDELALETLASFINDSPDTAYAAHDILNPVDYRFHEHATVSSLFESVSLVRCITNEADELVARGAQAPFYFKAHNGNYSRCYIQIAKRSDGGIMVIISEMPNNTGTSVTNAYERIATLVKNRYLRNVDFTDVVWIESDGDGKLYNVVNLQDNGDNGWFSNPKWAMPDSTLIAEIKKLRRAKERV